MQAWELKLKVRRQSCEFRLSFMRTRHGELSSERSRFNPWTEGYKARSEKMAALRDRIRRELEEIRFIKQMANVGPIVGNRMVLHVRDGTTHKVRPGPSIIDIMNRESDRFHEIWQTHTDGEYTHPVWTQVHDDIGQEYDARSVARGIDLALQILSNPYLFLDRDERTAYDQAEADEDKIVNNRAGTPTASQRILPAGQPAPSLARVKATSGGSVVVRRKKNETG